MEMRSFIIFWKWGHENYNSDIGIEDSNDCKIYSSSYSADNLQNCIEFINNLQSENIIVLLHTNDPNNFNNTHKETIKKQIENSTKHRKVYLFGGGPENNHPIYYHPGKCPKGILGNKDIDGNALVEKKDKLKEDHFEFVWDWYWNKLDIEHQKKKIIELWLPLAIDIQGLSEVEESKREAYLKVVLEQLDKINNGNSYAEKLIEDWNEVKKVLLPEDGNPVLEERYQIKDADVNKVKFPIEREGRKMLNSGTLKEYVKENWKKSQEEDDREKNEVFVPEFLPNWLHAVTNLLDDKITNES